MKQTKKGLSVKDLIVTGVFTALIFGCIMMGGGIFAAAPALTFYFPLGASLLAGPVYLLMIAKVKKFGPVTIAGAIMAVFTFMTGMHPCMSLGYLVGGVLADFIAKIGRHCSGRMNLLSYIVFCLGNTGSYLAYFIAPESWARFMLEGERATQDYVDIMSQTANTVVLITMLLGTVAVAALSAFIGTKLLKKQFEKAGITK